MSVYRAGFSEDVFPARTCGVEDSIVGGDDNHWRMGQELCR